MDLFFTSDWLSSSNAIIRLKNQKLSICEEIIVVTKSTQPSFKRYICWFLWRWRRKNRRSSKIKIIFNGWKVGVDFSCNKFLHKRRATSYGINPGQIKYLSLTSLCFWIIQIRRKISSSTTINYISSWRYIGSSKMLYFNT